MVWEYIKSILLGIVEGITEWLPVSSTGHLILVNEFLQLNVSDDPEVNKAFIEMFDVVIQLGAIMAVVVIFWKKLFPFGKKDNVKPFKTEGWGAYVKMDIMEMWLKAVVACLPAVVYGVLLDDTVSELYKKTIGSTGITVETFVVAAMLLIVGVLFIIIENGNKERKSTMNSISELTYKAALFIGVCQLIAAVFPGTSRSGATIIGALMIGVARTTAAEFTFNLAVPVMFGASLLKIVKYDGGFTAAQFGILIVASVVAFAVSIFVIRFLMDYIRKHDFKVFGWYRIVLAVLVLGYFGVKMIVA